MICSCSLKSELCYLLTLSMRLRSCLHKATSPHCTKASFQYTIKQRPALLLADTKHHPLDHTHQQFGHLPKNIVRLHAGIVAVREHKGPAERQRQERDRDRGRLDTGAIDRDERCRCRSIPLVCPFPDPAFFSTTLLSPI